MRTEQINPRYVELDSWSAAEMIAAMYEEQVAAATAVRGALPAIAAAVEDAVPALQRGGRIVYAGAGTSGRIGVQDGSELPPTFDWPADRVVFAMAGGLGALVPRPRGGEEKEGAGAQALAGADVGAHQVVIGIAGGGTTPLSVGPPRAASASGAGAAICAPPSTSPRARMAEPRTASAMARETAEIPAVAERLLARTNVFAAIAERIERARPRIVVFCGRGSSGHAGVYLRYLFE